jgi:hypothetical protein
MKTFTPPPITGYRTLSEEEVQLMNDVKHAGAHLEGLLNRLRQHPDIDMRWVHIGTTDLQKGLMAWTRAVAGPTSF